MRGLSHTSGDVAQVKIFPNPTAGILHITLETETTELMQVRVYDSYGQLLVSKVIPATSQAQIDLNSYLNASGILIMDINIGGNHYFKKIVFVR
jgi:hypothetical protein